MKEQLVEMTGLSPRVIRVWFQNKRCKDKKKTLQMKLQMQQEKVSSQIWQHPSEDSPPSSQSFASFSLNPSKEVVVFKGSTKASSSLFIGKPSN